MLMIITPTKMMLYTEKINENSKRKEGKMDNKR